MVGLWEAFFAKSEMTDDANEFQRSLKELVKSGRIQNLSIQTSGPVDRSKLNPKKFANHFYDSKVVYYLPLLRMPIHIAGLSSNSKHRFGQAKKE